LAVEVVEDATAATPVPLVADGRLVRPSGAEAVLATQISGGIVGGVTPLAVSSPDGESVIYNAWTDLVSIDPSLSLAEQGYEPGDAVGMPSLRLWTPGGDSVLAEAATSVAWRGDGGLAWADGDGEPFRLGEPYLRRIVVSATPGTAPEVWTSQPDQYVVVAWSAVGVIAQRVGPLGVDLVLVTRPDEVVELGPGGFQALDPSGRFLLVDRFPRSVLEVIDLDSLQVVDSLDLESQPHWFEGEVPGISSIGDWGGDRAVVSAGRYVIELGTDPLEVRQVLAFDSEDFPYGLTERRFTNDGTVVLLAPTPHPGGLASVPLDDEGNQLALAYRTISCDFETKQCVSPSPVIAKIVSFITNPSRP
jgi:hypothetical protein